MRFLVLLVVACGGGSKPTTTPVDNKPVEEALDPPCPAKVEFALPDGKLRCRELPLTLDFPANTTLKRADDGNLTFISATLDRGVLALFIEPRFDVSDDAAGLRARLEAAVKVIAADAVIVDAPAPPQPGATISTAISFSTPDGGAGVVHGYIAHNWFVAVIAGGRKPETTSRPDQPVGKAFLASLKLRPLSSKWVVQDVWDGLKLELPSVAWEGAPVKPTEGSVELATKLWSVASERVWIGARDLEGSAKCELFTGVADADVPPIVQKMFGREDLAVTGKLVKVGVKAMYAELETPGGTMTLYLICTDPRVVLITVTGKRPPAELRERLDHVTSTFKR